MQCINKAPIWSTVRDENATIEKKRLKYRSVGHEQRVSESPAQFWKPILGKSSLTEHTAHEDRGGWVFATSSSAKASGHEGLRLCIPSVGVVDANHSKEADENTNSLVNLQTKRERRLERRDLFSQRL